MRAFSRPRPRRVQITLFLAILAAAGCNRPREIPADTPNPRLYHRVVVLCIGINDYASPKIKDLSYAEPDAAAIARASGRFTATRPCSCWGKLPRAPRSARNYASTKSSWAKKMC